MKQKFYKQYISDCRVSSSHANNIVSYKIVEPNIILFLKRFYYVLIILLLPIITLIIICAFVNPVNHINILIAIISYLGSCFVGLFVFYFSWQNIILNKNSSFLYLSIEVDSFLIDISDIKKDLLSGYTDISIGKIGNPDVPTANAIKFLIKNIHETIAMEFKPIMIVNISRQSDSFEIINHFSFYRSNNSIPLCKSNESIIYLPLYQKDVDKIKGKNGEKYIVINFILDQFHNVLYICTILIFDCCPCTKTSYVPNKLVTNVLEHPSCKNVNLIFKYVYNNHF